MQRVFCINENHSLSEWFKKTYGDKEKTAKIIERSVNCATQLAMNLLILTQGSVHLFVFYVMQHALAELAVVLAEGLVYYLALPKLADPYYAEEKHPILYAVMGNLSSFVLGYWLSNWFPMLFS